MLYIPKNIIAKNSRLRFQPIKAAVGHKTWGQVFIFNFFMNPMAINLPAMSGTAWENASRGL